MMDREQAIARHSATAQQVVQLTRRDQFPWRLWLDHNAPREGTRIPGTVAAIDRRCGVGGNGSIQGQLRNSLGHPHYG